MSISLIAVALASLIAVCAGQQYELIPGIDGTLQLVDISLYIHISRDFEVKFILYTQANPAGVEIVSGDAASLDASGFSNNSATRIMIHGWINDRNSPSSVTVRNGYLNRGDFNVIVVDWSDGANSINYIEARYNVDDAGEKVAQFLNFLNDNGVDSNDIYLIGHSLGAHVAGFAGKYAANKPNTIYGLDPALPLFSRLDESTRLATGDAVYVQTILTDASVLGFDIPIGQATFYPAWGRLQPGCVPDLTLLCSHERAHYYFAESLKLDNGFVGKRCSSTQITLRLCLLTSTALMGGEPSNHGVTGQYYVPVNANSPHAKGSVS